MKYTKEYLKKPSIAIKCDNRAQGEQICDILGINEKDRITASDLYLSWNHIGRRFDFYDFDTCRNDRIILASEVIADYEASKPKRNIKGYKAPFDLYGGIIKKFYILEPATNNHYWHVNGMPETIYLPAEIVEQWEPVYEEEKQKHMIGGFSELIDYFKDTE
jgi:hypothetical protein